MHNKNQRQEASSESTAIQAGRDISIAINGISCSDARNIALDVFNANFYKLSEQAALKAVKRAEEITEKFLFRLQKENPEGLVKACEPDFDVHYFQFRKNMQKTEIKTLGICWLTY